MARILFQSIRSQGALLPADYLVKIVEGKADGVTPEAYHLPPGSRLRSEAYQVYERLLKYWARFQEARKEIPEDQDGEGITNKEWTTHLLDELRWGRPNAGTGVVFNEREYKIKRFSAHVPLHLVGCNQPLDRRGSSTSIPHGMVQEFLNASDGHLWAIVTNGLQLRLLRDNPALSRMAFVEFDLEAMMEDPSLFPDFLIFWHLCHHSRLEHAVPEETWLEKWSQGAIQDGAPVLDKLRVGVEQAVVHLGKGFLEHRANEALRDKIRSQELSALEYYRQLLRIIYRLLFLFVSEDRKLLHSPDASEDARKTFDEFYSTRRLRELADSMRGTPHADLWHQLSLLFHAMGDPEGCPQLGLPALGSFLWRADPSSTPDLDGPRPGSEGSAVQISNKNLLSAIRSIAYLQDDRDKAYRPVDFRVLDTQAFGSVYESLLELHPYFDANGRNFELRSSSGADRKQTGSYYTPDSLVQCLLDSALEPVLKKKLEGKSSEEQEKALLSMKVCDPAVGSGHFLISAAHRLAYRLSRITSGDTEPSPEAYQEALRKVTANCLYGVDLNPMAVELCQFTLWLESVEPGKPFAFLDHHIQCGNSLLGVTPKLLAEGIPDGAFKPLEGDERSVCTELAAHNRRMRKEREKKQARFDFGESDSQVNLSDEFSRLSSTEDDSVSAVSQKEKIYNQLVGADEYQNAKLLADLWCSVFTWKKDHSETARICPTDDDFFRFENNPENIPTDVRAEVRNIAKQYNFFHWHLAFPEVFQLPDDGNPENAGTGWSGGFDVILGNPPWERVKLQEKEFFALRDPEIANAPNAAFRRRKIAALETENSLLYDEFKQAVREAEGTSSMLRNSNVYPLCGRGDVNLYTVFAEANRFHLNPKGLTGLVLPTGIATDDTTKFFFQDLLDTKSLCSLYDFENKKPLFQGVHRMYKFCCFTAGSGVTPISESAEFAFFMQDPIELRDSNKCFRLSPNDIALLNPNTRNCSIFRSRQDAEITKHIYKRVPVLLNEKDPENGNPWGIKFSRMFDMSNDSHLFKTREQLEEDRWQLVGNRFLRGTETYLPLYEAKMIWHFDHRYGDYSDLPLGSQSTQLPEVPVEKKLCPNYFPTGRYWVNLSQVKKALGSRQSDNWFIGFRDITNASNERTAITSIFPVSSISNKLPLIVPTMKKANLVQLVADHSSFIHDYISRQKMGGTSMNYFIAKQISCLPPDVETQSYIDVKRHSLELTYTAWDLEDFAKDCGYNCPPFRWDEDRRFLLRCELDATFFHLYLGSQEDWQKEGTTELLESFPTPRDTVSHIMENFTIVKKRDIARTEVKDDSGKVIKEGTFITKDTILSIYDDMAEAQRTGQPYQTRLDPPPADPSCAHPPRA